MLYFRQFNSFKLKDFPIILELKGHRFYFIYFPCESISNYFRGGEPYIYIYINIRVNFNFSNYICILIIVVVFYLFYFF